MSKPAQFRALFFELRQILGPDVSSSQLAQIAQFVMQAHKNDEDGIDGWGNPIQAKSLSTMDVSDAMSDGGWRILEYETRRHGKLDDEGTRKIWATRLLLEKFLGPTWRYQDPPDQL